MIRKSYKPQPKIILLRNTFDFRCFAFTEPFIVISQLKNHTFLHQLKIAFAPKEDVISTMWAKTFSTKTTWMPQDGVKLLKESLTKKDVGSKDLASSKERRENAKLS
jgi:hypothetical protein